MEGQPGLERRTFFLAEDALVYTLPKPGAKSNMQGRGLLGDELNLDDLDIKAHCGGQVRKGKR